MISFTFKWKREILGSNLLVCLSVEVEKVTTETKFAYNFLCKMGHFGVHTLGSSSPLDEHGRT